MSKMTRAQLVEELEAILETSGVVIEQSLHRYINLAGRRVWYSRRWDERQGLFVFKTVAPETISNATVTNDSTTITCATATFQTNGWQEGDKIAAGIGETPYVIESVDSETQLTVEQSWIGDSSTTQSLTLYRDEFDIEPAAHAIRSVGLYRQNPGLQPDPITERGALDILFVPVTKGVPAYYNSVYEGDDDIQRIRLHPVPDAEYIVGVHVWKHWVNLKSDDDVHGLSIEREYLLLEAALLWAQRLVTDTRPKFTTERELEEKISLAWDNHNTSPKKTVQRAGFDQVPKRGRWADWTGLS